MKSTVNSVAASVVGWRSGVQSIWVNGTCWPTSGLGVGEAASRLGVSRVMLSRVLHGHARVSPNLAVRLELAGVGTARAWLAMQTVYALAAERAAGVPKVRRLDDVA